MKKIKLGVFALLILIRVFLAGCSSEKSKGSELVEKENKAHQSPDKLFVRYRKCLSVEYQNTFLKQ